MREEVIQFFQVQSAAQHHDHELVEETAEAE